MVRNPATDLIRGRRWHKSQEVTDLPGGSLRLRMHLNSVEEMVGWVLSWGTRVQDLGAADASGPARQLSLADSWSTRRKAP